jgi:hypothetical protein
MTDTATTTDQVTQDAGKGSASDEAAKAETAAATPESWFGALPEDAKTIAQAWLDKEAAGLKSALTAERAERKTDRQQFQTQLTDAIAKASGDSKAELEKMSASLSESGTRQDFYADAHEAGAGDLRLAWAAVKEYELYDRKGNPDIEALKTKCPYLFQPAAKPVPKVGAGSGTQTKPAAAEIDPLRAAVARAKGVDLH